MSHIPTDGPDQELEALIDEWIDRTLDLLAGSVLSGSILAGLVMPPCAEDTEDHQPVQAVWPSRSSP
ncbi:hypothetical protein J8J14_18285 [Roseomonas sp. SSH11]|uniref:Uncharacterized protein n=1 Tax=Pararoseomonas baculiformis TaxID=2820812 RepID=A0ABS4AI76_9PROT|nr:hypothetical protein [Pararoseomonas baculiformis]MBP0446727.1 hypothetical protein [Pararoseomonas baculiformis]